ncbi:MAG: hypothetical protein V7K92_07425 [Nostoc sp.]
MGILRQALASPFGRRGDAKGDGVSPSKGASRVGGYPDLNGLASSGVRRCSRSLVSESDAHRLTSKRWRSLSKSCHAAGFTLRYPCVKH